MRSLIVSLVLAAAPTIAIAQTSAQTAQQSTPKPTPPSTGLHRWLDVQTGLADARYRLVESDQGVRTANQIQHRQTLKGALKLDPAARYTVQFGVGSGTAFTGSWDNTGAGTGGADWNPAVRQLYLSAALVTGFDVQVGGLAPIRGEATEFTSYDNDGFLVGERVSVKRPARLWFDEIAFTAGHLGQFDEPNVFERVDNWSDHNYAQVLVAKKFNARVAASFDWTTAADEDTLRQGLRIALKESRVVDAVRVEAYQRVTASTAPGSATGRGFAATLERTLSKALSLSGGYANIDRHNPTLNADRFLRGQRGFVEARYALTPEVTLSTFYTRAFGNDFAVPIGTRFDVIVSYNVLKALQRNGLW